LTAPDALEDGVLFCVVFPGDQDLDGLADDLFCHIAKDSLGPFVPAGNDTVEIFTDNCIIARFHNGREQKRGVYLALALRNVTSDLRRPDDLTLRVSDRRDGQRDINQASIFAPTNCFIMVNAFASSDLLKNKRLLVSTILWDQYRHGLPDNFRGLISEEPGCCVVPAADDAVEIFADNCVIRRVDDGRQALRSLLGTLSLCNVHQHVHRSNEHARRVENGRWEGEERNASAIGTFRYRFQAPDRLLFLHRSGHRALIVRHCPSIRPEELPRSAPFAVAEIRPAAPKRSSGLVVVRYAAGGIRRVDRRRKRVDQLSKEIIAFNQWPRSACDEIGDRESTELMLPNVISSDMTTTRAKANEAGRPGPTRCKKCLHGVNRGALCRRHDIPGEREPRTGRPG